jgi:hypothetical protein
MKRRRLGDLYVLGKELVVNDGQGESVTVWIHKLNDIDRDAVIRRANAVKARHLIDAGNEDSEVFQSAWGQVREYDDRDALVAVVIADEVVKYRRRVEAELGENEETWGKDNYLQGLVDAWFGDEHNEGLTYTHITHPDDPEVVRVMGELNRFSQEVTKRVTDEADRLEREWAEVPDDKLWNKAAHRLLERRADEVFTKEFERQQMFYAVREPEDHKKRYFGTIDEVDDLPDKIRHQIQWAYNEIIVDPHEAKDSPATQASSSSSEPPAAETSPEPSGLEVANA